MTGSCRANKKPFQEYVRWFEANQSLLGASGLSCQLPDRSIVPSLVTTPLRSWVQGDPDQCKQKSVSLLTHSSTCNRSYMCDHVGRSWSRRPLLVPLVGSRLYIQTWLTPSSPLLPTHSTSFQHGYIQVHKELTGQAFHSQI